MTNAIKNVAVQIAAWVPAANSTGYIPRGGLAGPCGHPLELCEELFPTVAEAFGMPTSSAQRFRSLHVLTNTCSWVFGNSHPSGCDAASHCGLDLHLPHD